MRPAILVVVTVFLVIGCARRSALLDPLPTALSRPAPDSFIVAFETTRGRFDVRIRRGWAPIGADRLHYLVRKGYYNGARFFRVVPGFVVQFGLAADPAVSQAWTGRTLRDDRVRSTNHRGSLSFARGGPNSRTTQLFVNLRDNARLDTLGGFGFPPLGEVMGNGMAVVDSIYAGYGEQAPRGAGPVQDSLRVQGEAYVAKHFPRLDAITRAWIVRDFR